MASKTSRSGQRWLAVTLAIAALVSGAWFLPEMPGRVIQSIEVPQSDFFGSNNDRIAVFHTAEEFRQTLRPDASGALPAVDWSSMDLVRVRCGAPGYIVEGETNARYGTLEHDTRLGGYKLFVYLYEPDPNQPWIGTNANRVFSQMFREAWFAVPKGTRLEWDSGGIADYDLIFGVLTGLLSFAFLLVVFRLRRIPRDVKAGHSGFERELAAAVSSR